MKNVRIVFMGTPEFAVSSLKSLVDAGENIVGVVTAPDRPAGRGRKISESDVKVYAKEQGLKILQPTNLKDQKFIKELKSLNAELQVVVAFRMLPAIVWQMPRYGTFNLHASLLPDYRGAAPINWAVINGENKTGVTTFFIDEKIDTGAVILQKATIINDDDNAGDLHDKLMQLGSDLVLETIRLIKNGTTEAQAQVKNQNLHPAPKLDRSNTQIDWQSPVDKIRNLIRGLNPHPSAWTAFKNNGKEMELKIYAAHIAHETEVPDKNKDEGTIATYQGKLFVKCGDGSIVIDELKLPGKRKMKTKDLLNGFNIGEDANVL